MLGNLQGFFAIAMRTEAVQVYPYRALAGVIKVTADFLTTRLTKADFFLTRKNDRFNCC
jgi:hypothetical protein